MKPERRFNFNGKSNVEVRELDDGRRTISGYAAVFYRDGDESTQYKLDDNYIERIAPDFFNSVVGQDVRALVNHDVNLVLGRLPSGTLRLRIDDIGLRYEIDVPDTQVGRDTLVLIKRGDVSGSSFSFIPARATFEERADGKVIRTLEEAEALFDVGPVTFPAYEGTSAEARDQFAAEFRAYRNDDDEEGEGNGDDNSEDSEENSSDDSASNEASLIDVDLRIKEMQLDM